MADLADAQRVDKEELLEALSKKEGEYGEYEVSPEEFAAVAPEEDGKDPHEGGPSQHVKQVAKSAAHELHADELRRAKRAIKKDRQAQQEEEVLLQALKDEQMRREEDARYHQLQGRKRLKEAQDKQTARKEQMEEVREARFDYDVKRVMQLKAILLKIKSQNERREKKQQKVKAAQWP
ncbi:unnamed protein product [Cladocopium goreaui]|uniref:Uncharacterized protein n=1 Tax=Cladocopium goreaui TaxID=2562237 RepID=A0A9P1M506_9DINO|nr:unnamed protein product [Cladocopium goreaui]